MGSTRSVGWAVEASADGGTSAGLSGAEMDSEMGMDPVPLTGSATPASSGNIRRRKAPTSVSSSERAPARTTSARARSSSCAVGQRRARSRSSARITAASSGAGNGRG